MSLTLRLFFNILAKELVLTLLAGLILVFYSLSMPKVIQILLIGGDFALRPFIIWLGFLVSFVQALVFTSLAMIYIGTAVQEHDHK
jgi:F0F1-type ATP synthase membrane subunit a